MILRCLFVAGVSLFAASSLFAQGNSGSILGTVTDSSGGVVAAAGISVTNTRTGVRAETVSDALGNYLQLSRRVLTVWKPKFPDSRNSLAKSIWRRGDSFASTFPSRPDPSPKQ